MEGGTEISDEFLEFQSVLAGRYSLERELGRGGMGVVFLAREVALERHVAIKLLPTDMARRSELRARFVTEARTAAKLSHPNIIPIYTVDEIAPWVFFVMAYIKGKTLGDLVAARGPLKHSAAIPILREIAWALAYAHAQGVVHRDIKPDNILLEDGSNRALVTDFGIAHVVGDEPSEPWEMFGTPEYMSPEQATGEPVDTRSDVYALGATAFYALSGHPPFTGAEASEILAHHIRTPPPRLASHGVAVPGKLGAVVHECLAKNPAERPQSGEAVAEALSQLFEVTKETPVPIRIFLRHTREQRGNWIALTLLLWWMGGIFFVGLMMASPAVRVIGAPGLLFAITSIPLMWYLHRARQLLRAGCDRGDLLRALNDNVVERDEELQFLYGEKYRISSQRLFRYSGLGLTAGITLMGMGVSAASLLLGFGGLFTVLVSGGIMRRASRMSTRKERWRVRLWKGWFGRLIFKLAGFGVHRASDSAIPASRPTEMAVGASVLSLFESLPKTMQASLADLPEAVRGLEDDAQHIRKQILEFDDMLMEASPNGVAVVDGFEAHRQQAFTRIEDARRHAQQKLSQTVAALENLRIDLLRMRAGTASLDSVTGNLGSAREVAAQVDRLLEAHADIAEVTRKHTA